MELEGGIPFEFETPPFSVRFHPALPVILNNTSWARFSRKLRRMRSRIAETVNIDMPQPRFFAEVELPWFTYELFIDDRKVFRRTYPGEMTQDEIDESLLLDIDEIVRRFFS